MFEKVVLKKLDHWLQQLPE